MRRVRFSHTIASSSPSRSVCTSRGVMAARHAKGQFRQVVRAEESPEAVRLLISANPSTDDKAARCMGGTYRQDGPLLQAEATKGQ